MYIHPFLLFVKLSLYLSNPCFLLLQGMLMMKGLIDRCLSQEVVVDQVKVKVKATKVELGELKAWKVV